MPDYFLSRLLPAGWWISWAFAVIVTYTRRLTVGRLLSVVILAMFRRPHYRTSAGM
jgi:hypothetical protein